MRSEVEQVKDLVALHNSNGNVKYSNRTQSDASGKKITAGMSDSDRADILRDKEIVFPLYTGQADASITKEEANLRNGKRSLAEAALIRIGKEFDVFSGGKLKYDVADMGVKVSFSVGAMRESAHKEVTDARQLAKLMPILHSALESAIGIESHDNRYFYDNTTAQYHELFGGYVDGNLLVPVRFGIKELTDGSMNLHVIVSQEKIKMTGVLVPEGVEKSSGLAGARPVKMSLSQIVPHVNSADVLRYLPDKMLSSKQIEKNMQRFLKPLHTQITRMISIT